MKFDVIVGNPPYQLSDGGGRESSAMPLYHTFVEQAINMSPKYLSMIIPARWYSGGKGLDEFRDFMITDKRIMVLHDYPETSDCFPGLNIRGGVCYFLWSIKHHGECLVFNHLKGVYSQTSRYLKEGTADVFIRYNEAIGILRKVQKLKEKCYESIVSSRKPFGLDSNFSDYSDRKNAQDNIKLLRFGTPAFISIDKILRNQELIGKYKVLVSKASPGGDEYPHMIVSQPIAAGPDSACTETYLIIDVFDNSKEANNLITYIKTRFFRFMMSLVKNTQNISKASYKFVPLQDFSHPWTDEMLYKKYGLTPEEIAFIESMIRTME